MKKVFLLMAMVATVLLSSCKEGQFGFVYSAAANGDAKGDVALTFPVGEFKVNGDAALSLVVSNDTTKILTSNAITLEQAFESSDPKIVKAATAIDEWVDANFNVAGGDYYVHLLGYVKETLTGIEVRIDREFTNRK